MGMSIASRIKQARKAAGLTQVELAARCGLNQSTISDLEVGKAHGSTFLATIASVLGVNALWLESAKGPMQGGSELVKLTPSNVLTFGPDDEQSDDFVFVPESRIEFAAGNGKSAMYELVEDEEPATYRRSWFQKHGINPERVRRFRVAGDSMEPMLYARDTILVNEDERNVVDGKMYAMRYGDELRVKFVSRRLDGTLLLRSVNPAYPVEEIAPELVEQHIAILGRVRDTSGTGGL